MKDVNYSIITESEIKYTDLLRKQLKPLKRILQIVWIKTLEKNIANCVKDNPKKLELCSVEIKSAIPDLYKDDNKKDVTESNKGKVDVFADFFFTSVLTKDKDSEMHDIVPKEVPELNNNVKNSSIVKKNLIT